MNASSTAHTRVLYDEVSLALRNEYPIDDIWDSKHARFLGGGELRIVRVARQRSPNECVAIVTRGSIVLRFKVRDPRVGCLLYKIFLRHTPRSGDSLFLLKKSIVESLERSCYTPPESTAPPTEEWRRALKEASDDLDDRRQLHRVGSLMQQIHDDVDDGHSLDERGEKRLIEAQRVLRGWLRCNPRINAVLKC